MILTNTIACIIIIKMAKSGVICHTAGHVTFRSMCSKYFMPGQFQVLLLPTVTHYQM